MQQPYGNSMCMTCHLLLLTSTREPALAARAALHSVHMGLKDSPMSHLHRSFTPTVACIAAVILAFFLAFVEYEHPEGSAAQVNTAVPLFVVVVEGVCCGSRRRGYKAIVYHLPHRKGM